LLKYFTFLLLFLSVFSCKTDSANTSENEAIYDKYDDEFTNFEYNNKKLGIKIIFDKEWVITTQFKDFSENQKKYAKYFSSTNSEVLFIGYNDEKKIGVKLTNESLSLKNSEYFSKIKSTNSQDIYKYKTKFISENIIFLKNLQATNFLMETTFNPNNIFTFEGFLFKNEKDNFRLDFWTTKSNYESVKEYIKSICQTIDFPEGVKYNQADTTSDITIKDQELINSDLTTDEKLIQGVTPYNSDM